VRIASPTFASASFVEAMAAGLRLTVTVTVTVTTSRRRLVPRRASQAPPAARPGMAATWQAGGQTVR
jgi:hypothetical protein